MSRWREGKGRTNVRLLLHDTRWILSFSDSARISRRQWGLFSFFFLFIIFSPPPNDQLCVSVLQLHTTMDSDTGEMIEEFMESALAQWVCHLSLDYLTGREGSSFAVKVERVSTLQIPIKSLNRGCYFLLSMWWVAVYFSFHFIYLFIFEKGFCFRSLSTQQIHK